MAQSFGIASGFAQCGAGDQWSWLHRKRLLASLSRIAIVVVMCKPKSIRLPCLVQLTLKVNNIFSMFRVIACEFSFRYLLPGFKALNFLQIQGVVFEDGIFVQTHYTYLTVSPQMWFVKFQKIVSLGSNICMCIKVRIVISIWVSLLSCGHSDIVGKLGLASPKLYGSFMDGLNNLQQT